MGSLQTALASFLVARAAAGYWHLRIDDLDAQRCRPEHADTILRQLEAHGLHWDGPVYRQSRHLGAYQAARARLHAQGRLYACACTRARLAGLPASGPFGRVYDARCRDLALPPGPGTSLRLRLAEGARDDWRDGSGPRLQADLVHALGDFVVWRADDTPGYQLACAVDEASMGITEVVRGADLLGSTFCQRHLLACLDLPVPAYRHLPLRLDAQGRKLSKQNHALGIAATDAAVNLIDCLRALGQAAPAAAGSAAELLEFALAHWDTARLPPAETACALQQGPE